MNGRRLTCLILTKPLKEKQLKRICVCFDTINSVILTNVYLLQNMSIKCTTNPKNEKVGDRIESLAAFRRKITQIWEYMFWRYNTIAHLILTSKFKIKSDTPTVDIEDSCKNRPPPHTWKSFKLKTESKGGPYCLREVAFEIIKE